jgi:hypothetical protein
MDDPYRHKVYAKLCDVLIRENITEVSPLDLITLLKVGMEFAERMRKLNGQSKKTLVVYSMVTILDKTVEDESMKHILKMMLEPTIDALCEISKHKWNINLKPITACCFAYTNKSM